MMTMCNTLQGRQICRGCVRKAAVLNLLSCINSLSHFTYNDAVSKSPLLFPLYLFEWHPFYCCILTSMWGASVHSATHFDTSHDKR